MITTMLKLPLTPFLCATILLTGCGHYGHSDLGAVNFRTLISTDNSKRFELSVAPKSQDPMRQLKRRGNAYMDEDSRSVVQQRRTDAYLKYQLEDLLDKNGFCRGGYLMLGRFAGESQIRLRGECKDTATPEDRQRFPNTIEKW